MWRAVILFIFFNSVIANEKEEKSRIVVLTQGAVRGVKYWDGDYYEFYGIPYAEIPKGRDKYQAPLPVKPWSGLIDANSKNIVCHQSYFTGEQEDEEFILNGEEDCLVANVFVPEVASEENLVPVVVYIHSGAFSGGNGNMARFHYLVRHDIIVVSMNYRLGALGFACLGNREIPGNAGLKDQVAALKWINMNIKKFGGDPNKVTLAGYSVGASMAEILTLSKTTKGLFDKLILESASALSPFAINRDPIDTAKNIAFAMGYNGTGNLDSLTEFYLNVSVKEMAAKSLNFFLSNSTFGYAPCIENVHEGIEPILTEAPIDILKKGQYNKVSLLTGFSNMEGISRTIKFGEWRELMSEDFSPFIPADLKFTDEKSKESLIKKIRERYFKGAEVTADKLQGYVDYFSDAMFKYSIMKSLKLHATSTKRPMYLYEFSYLGKLNMHHNYKDRLKGASHRDQTAYILDFFGWTNNYRDLNMRERMTTMWSDFVKYGDPTAYESQIITYKWPQYTNDNPNYLQIHRKQTPKKNILVDSYKFWDEIYEKYYWTPSPPTPPKEEPVLQQEVKQTNPKVMEKKEDLKAKQSSDAKNKEAIKVKPTLEVQAADEQTTGNKEPKSEKPQTKARNTVQKNANEVKKEVKEDKLNVVQSEPKINKEKSSATENKDTIKVKPTLEEDITAKKKSDSKESKVEKSQAKEKNPDQIKSNVAKDEVKQNKNQDKNDNEENPSINKVKKEVNDVKQKLSNEGKLAKGEEKK